jgi:hypothetical protein
MPTACEPVKADTGDGGEVGERLPDLAAAADEVHGAGRQAGRDEGVDDEAAGEPGHRGLGL